MTTTNATRTFEKKVLPEKKPILMVFDRIPKEGKPSVYNGQEKARIGLMLRVADNKYPDLIGYPVFRRISPWVNGGPGQRATHLYDLLCEMLMGPVPNSLVRTDARDWPEETWKALFGPYVVKMEAPDYDESGAMRWQDISEILHPEGIEFNVEGRLAEIPRYSGGAQAKPAGLGLPTPKGSQIPPQAPANPSEQPQPTPPQEMQNPAPASQPTEPPATEKLLTDLKDWFGKGQPFKDVIWTVLHDNGVKQGSALNAAEVKRLHAICKAIASYHGDRERTEKANRYRAAIEVPLHKLTVAQAERLEAEATAPF